MGGKWEAAVTSTKFHLHRTVGDTLLTFEELTTLLAQIEAVLSSRRLEPLTDDWQDVLALTPGHFLVGGPLTTVPEQSLPISGLAHWQLFQHRVRISGHNVVLTFSNTSSRSPNGIIRPISPRSGR